MEKNKAVIIEGLTKSFKKNRVLHGINLQIERGTMLALLGPNGAGKTTTIRILSTLLHQDGGTVMVNGFDVEIHPDKVRESIGLTGQFAAVDEYLTGFENLEMMGRLYHLSYKDTRRRANELLEQFDLVEASRRNVKTYSGGMRRKLDLALSLISTPPILFLDEPTTGLDPRSRLAMWDVIKKLIDSGVTILLTTQYLEEADQLADRIAVMDDGKIITEGTSEELKNQIGNERFELVFSTSIEFDQAIEVFRQDEIQPDPFKRSISIPTSGDTEEVRRILELMARNKIKIESLSLHKPTLDDVFINFTGHKVEEVAEELINKK